MDIISFISEKGLILIPAALIIGAVVTKIPYIPDWGIPLIVLLAGIIGGGFLIGWGADGIIQGILAAGAATFGHQMVMQIVDRGSEDNDGGGKMSNLKY
jgi:hypothetical protein